MHVTWFSHAIMSMSLLSFRISIHDLGYVGMTVTLRFPSQAADMPWDQAWQLAAALCSALHDS